MSFSRSRHALIPNSHPNTHDPHFYSHNPTNKGIVLQKQNRDRDRFFVDLDSASVHTSKRKRTDFSSSFDRADRYYSHNHDSSRNANEEFGVNSFISRDEIERCSPSRKDGIDFIHETNLRYSYCSYLQCLGMRLELPQITTGSAMVLCHRFFVRRSHASYDRFLIATAALFLATKTEESPCLLNTVLRASCEVCQMKNIPFFPHLVYSNNWFDLYREKVTEAEQLILTTLDFEMDVHHPYSPLTTVLSKLGLSHTVLFNLAWNMVSEGLRTSLWLQFKPHNIAAGAVFVAARFINFDLSYYPTIWHEFRTSPSTLQDVVRQLMEIF